MSVIATFTNKTQPVSCVKSQLVKAENVIDFSLTPCLSGDVVQAIEVEAGDIVLTAGFKVLTGETGNVTYGDGVDPDLFVTTQSVASTGTFVSNGAILTAGSKAYTVADTLDLTLSANMDSGKIAVYAVIAKLEN
jgi:hypothetical protein